MAGTTYPAFIIIIIFFFFKVISVPCYIVCFEVLGVANIVLIKLGCRKLRCTSRWSGDLDCLFKVPSVTQNVKR